MIINMCDAFPNVKFLTCPSCYTLLGCKEEDIVEFKNERCPNVTIHGIVCPACTEFMLISGLEDDDDKNKETFWAE